MRTNGKLLLLLLIAPLALGGASCGGKPPVVDYAKIRDCSPEFDGQVISLEGYVGANRQQGLAFCSKNDKYALCLVSFAPSPDEKTKLTASLDMGPGPNQMDSINRPGGMDENSTLDDNNRRLITEMIRFRTNDGKTLTARDKVRVTGKYLSVPAGNDWPGSCSIAVTKIEGL